MRDGAYSCTGLVTTQLGERILQAMNRSTSSKAPNEPKSSASQTAPAGSIPIAALEGVALGIDVGGTGVKAAMVDLATAELVTPRIREKTPQPSTPVAVIDTMASVVAPGVKISSTPACLSVGISSSGMIPPPKTAISSAPDSFSSSITFGNR